jgi:vancomycin aglycone glucosyltransferase
VALASHLKALGHEVRSVRRPTFRDWVESLGMPVTPIGPVVRQVRCIQSDGHAAANAADGPAQRRQMMEATVATQFETLTSAPRKSAT